MKNINLKLFCSECGNILEINNPEILDNDFTVFIKPCRVCGKSSRLVDMAVIRLDEMKIVYPVNKHDKDWNSTLDLVINVVKEL